MVDMYRSFQPAIQKAQWCSTEYRRSMCGSGDTSEIAGIGIRPASFCWVEFNGAANAVRAHARRGGRAAAQTAKERVSLEYTGQFVRIVRLLGLRVHPRCRAPAALAP